MKKPPTTVAEPPAPEPPGAATKSEAVHVHPTLLDWIENHFDDKEDEPRRFALRQIGSPHEGHAAAWMKTLLPRFLQQAAQDTSTRFEETPGMEVTIITHLAKRFRAEIAQMVQR